ncbi:metal-dependent phosphohydrolase [Phormidium sp. LEGE 05292]|uniref:Npun_R2479 family HD domain-containing metalloprotein n=1 Tax=[Phormidium] sp. LEGE 05292 TaxID=767427 RepID=UPI0018814E35|nr:Npun_R2479 family HD domain-containing metalloprotein [Phormidium sp. LEGE 05292]MBE9226267.1 metal-dependent phosphohydrolase [Phormidium sp. LEGE 05292]
MFNATQILIDTFVEQLREGYRRTYGGLKTDYEDIIGWAGSMALENIANSDALYHNVEHTILVTLVGQEILRGKHIREGGVSCEDWLHYIISLLCHDIGYVKGVCRQDKEEEGLYATGKDGGMVKLAPGASDASLTPHHVDRGKLFITERFGGHKLIDADVIKRSIELTRFPVPSAEDHQDTVNYAGLVRAADLIGQLSDPRYLKKITSLYYEFEETGVNKALNYRHPGDLRRNYSKFYWNGVFPFIKDALRYLQLTQQGKQIIANLYSNVFVVEHEKAEEERRQLVEQLN